MHDFSCTDPEQMVYEPLAKRTRYFKEDMKGVGSMCRALEEMRNETEYATKKRIIERLLTRGGMTVQEVADTIELPLADVEAIASELQTVH